MRGAKKTPSITFLDDACCGCGVCAAVCPRRCIRMSPDTYGFLESVINTDICVGCGACDTACPALNLPARDEIVETIWAKAQREEILERSSSGGIFGLLAQDLLARGGIVSGAAWADGCRKLHHVVVEDESGLDTVMRSKYVQSSVDRKVYEGIRDALRNHRPVLFCGTACQVSGMRSYLGKLANSDLFLGVDVICHGVPSPKLWRRWLDYVESRECGEVHEVNFRSKITGWLSFSVMYKYITEKDSASRFSANKFAEDWYMKAFLKNASLRKSCFSCPFKRRCGSDLTLGDFWGIQRQHPEAPIEGGVSAVLVNTDKGAKAVAGISASLLSGASSTEKVAAGNSALIRPVAAYSKRADFMAALSEGMPIEEMMAHWDFKPTLKQKAISKAKGVVKRLLGRS